MDIEILRFVYTSPIKELSGRVIQQYGWWR